MMQRAVNIEAKAGLKSSIIAQKLNVYYSKGHRSSYATFSKIQIQKTKEFKLKESRPKESKLAKGKTFALACIIFAEPGKTFCQDKKKEYLKKKQDRKNFNLVTKDNAIKGEKKWADKSAIIVRRKVILLGIILNL